MEPAEISAAVIAKSLVACNQSSRNRAVSLLCSWLPNQPANPSSAADAVSDAELLRIWKGLFFCVWHSDKLPSQLDLINRLSALLSSLPCPLAGRYLDAFFVTIRREWSGIDFLRLDKFYLLICRFLRHCFLFLKKNSWNLDLTHGIVSVVLERSLLSADKFPAAGVSYHIAEIFLDEIVEFLPLAMEIVNLVMKPFFAVLQTSNDEVLVNKVKVNIFDRLAENAFNLLNGSEAVTEVEKFGTVALAMGFSKRLFGLASAPGTLQGNRKVLFGLHDIYLKLEKELEKSGLDISLEHLDSGSSVQESECVVEAAGVFATCIDGGGDNDESRLMRKMKKKSKKKSKKKKKENEALRGTEGKPKKKRKKSLGSSTESNAVSSIDSNATKPGEQKSESKKKKKKLAGLPTEGNAVSSSNLENKSNAVSSSNEIVCGDSSGSDNNNLFSFDDTVLSHLQKQFEKVAALAGMLGACNPKVSKKRKLSKNTDTRQALVSSKNVGGSDVEKTMESNVKKVRFSMKNNVIWNSQNPLPPQSVRLPPSVIPRGSALKKGLSPGPIRESPPTVNKIKVKGSSVKKARKIQKKVSPVVKHIRLLQGFSV